MPKMMSSNELIDSSSVQVLTHLAPHVQDTPCPFGVPLMSTWPSAWQDTSQVGSSLSIQAQCSSRRSVIPTLSVPVNLKLATPEGTATHVAETDGSSHNKLNNMLGIQSQSIHSNLEEPAFTRQDTLEGGVEVRGS